MGRTTMRGVGKGYHYSKHWSLSQLVQQILALKLNFTAPKPDDQGGNALLCGLKARFRPREAWQCSSPTHLGWDYSGFSVDLFCSTAWGAINVISFSVCRLSWRNQEGVRS
ncbi:hypothetical protein [Nitrosomonas sp. ANs5]|uniref:hypothetical protein n=1 Tax=Nitrosomonas sp. ANs5 TaxID=3423941 RepID=UPI003D357E7F